MSLPSGGNPASPARWTLPQSVPCRFSWITIGSFMGYLWDSNGHLWMDIYIYNQWNIEDDFYFSNGKSTTTGKSIKGICVVFLGCFSESVLNPWTTYDDPKTTSQAQESQTAFPIIELWSDSPNSLPARWGSLDFRLLLLLVLICQLRLQSGTPASSGCCGARLDLNTFQIECRKECQIEC